MIKQYSKRKPDFFVILVLLVLLGFGLTVTLQVIMSNLDNMTESQSVNQPIKTVQARS